MVIRSKSTVMVYNNNGTLKSRTITENGTPQDGNPAPSNGKGTIIKRTRTRIIKVIRKVVPARNS